MKQSAPPYDHEDNTLPTNTLAHIRSELKAKGLRCTRPREAIMHFFRSGDRHVSAEGLHRILHAQGGTFSLSTVYLNLTVLSQAGLIREISNLEGEKLFDSNQHDHHHIVCQHCHQVADVPIDALKLGLRGLDVALPEGWCLAQPNVVLCGCCPDCAAKACDCDA